MKHRSIFLFAATAFLISGCTAKTPEPKQETTPVVLEAPQKADKTLSASELLGNKLKTGMAYEDLRKIVLADGWLPLVTPECKDNVGGEAKICDQQPETEACSGDGHCNMLFAHGASQTKLRVGTYDSSVKLFEFTESDKAELTEATQSKPWPDTLSAEACTQKGYQAFFESFVRSDAIRKSHTSPNVEIRSISDNKPIKAKYDQFKIGLVDYVWIFLDPKKDISNYEQLDLKEKIIGSTYRVDYQRAEFGADDEVIKTYGAPGAYLFEIQDGCWRLTKEYR